MNRGLVVKMITLLFLLLVSGSYGEYFDWDIEIRSENKGSRFFWAKYVFGWMD